MSGVFSRLEFTLIPTMPEGHTNRRSASDRQKWFDGQKLTTSPQDRLESDANLLAGNQLQKVIFHGKHLCYPWSPETARKKIERSREPIRTPLLNRAIITGVGNEHRAEICFCAACLWSDQPTKSQVNSLTKCGD